MASVNIKKYSSKELRGLSVHYDLGKRKTLNHSNPDIDKSKSSSNYFFGADCYTEILAGLDRRKEEIDSEYPPRRIKTNRITNFIANIPVPQEITDKGLEHRFLQDAYRIIQQQFGEKNVIGMAVHVDEVHEYFDTRKKKMVTSLIHGDVFCVPYAEWTENDAERKGLNAKHCITRSRLISLQKAINDMCMEKYGIEYNTHDTPRHLSTEKLKRDSLMAEIELGEIELSNQRQHARAISRKIKALEDSADKAEELAAKLPKLQDLNDVVMKNAEITRVYMVEKAEKERYKLLYTKLKAAYDNEIELKKQRADLYDSYENIRKRISGEIKDLYELRAVYIERERRSMSIIGRVINKFKTFLTSKKIKNTKELQALVYEEYKAEYRQYGNRINECIFNLDAIRRKIDNMQNLLTQDNVSEPSANEEQICKAVPKYIDISKTIKTYEHFDIEDFARCNEDIFKGWILKAHEKLYPKSMEVLKEPKTVTEEYSYGRKPKNTDKFISL